MNKINNYTYDNRTDTFWIEIQRGVEEFYKEIVPGFRLEYNNKSEIIGIEIQYFSRFFNLNPNSDTKPLYKRYILKEKNPTNLNNLTYSFMSNSI